MKKPVPSPHNAAALWLARICSWHKRNALPEYMRAFIMWYERNPDGSNIILLQLDLWVVRVAWVDTPEPYSGLRLEYSYGQPGESMRALRASDDSLSALQWFAKTIAEYNTVLNN